MATKVMDISGRIMVPETISLDQVVDGFFEWLESKEWGFAGSFNELDENGEPIFLKPTE